MTSLLHMLAPLGAALAAHAPLVLAALSWLLANVLNRFVPVGHRSWWALLLDRAVVLTQRGAANHMSWPVFGRSLARELARGVLDVVPDDAPTNPSPPPRGMPGFVASKLLPFVFVGGILAWFVALGTAVPGCGATPRQVAHVSIVSGASAVASLDTANRRVYVEATDELRSALRSDGGALADYDRIVAPMDREYAARVDALVSLDAALYAAASINDAARAGGGDRLAIATAARTTLLAVQAGLDVLSAGHLLPPVPIPPDVRQAVTALTAVASLVEAGERAARPVDGGAG